MEYSKFSKIYAKVSAIRKVGLPDANKHHNQLLAESVVYDMLGSDDKVSQFLTEAASYIDSSEVLSEEQISGSSNEVVTLDEMNGSRSELMSILITAKEADDEDFKTFEKATMLMMQSFVIMRDKYNEHAKERVQSIQESIESDKRIMNVLQDIKK